MPPSLLPDWVLVTAFFLCAWVKLHADLVKTGRLKSYSIVTHFIATGSLVGIVLIGHFMPLRWHGGGKFWLIASCYLLMMVFGSVTKKLPAQSEAKRWKKTMKRSRLN